MVKKLYYTAVITEVNHDKKVKPHKIVPNSYIKSLKKNEVYKEAKNERFYKKAKN